MKKSYCKRLIAALVCVNIIINSIPVTFASETDVVQEESGTGITEVVSLREENVKHFDLGNGVYQAVIYDSAVHRLDSNGDWQEINNNLYLNNARSNQTYSGSNDRINFASSLSVNESIFELSENNYSVSMSLTADVMPLNAGTASVDAVVTNTSESRAVSNYFDSIEEAVQENNVTTVLYEEILNHTDLKYVLSGNDIKEYIIVKEKSESYSYRFELNMEGLYAELTADGSVWLLDTITKEKQYIIPAPFMYDANNVPSLDVEYSLTKSSENTYLTVTADADWINAEERVFPVTIDPTITTDSAIADTYVSSANPTVNYGSSSRMWVSDDRSATWGDTVTYMRFSLPDIPYGSLITSANVNAYYWYFDKITSGHITVGAYQMLYSWTESGLTWNSISGLGNQGTASSALGIAYAEGNIGAIYSSPKQMSIPITSLVNSWYSGTGNYGVAFKFMAGDNYSVIFNSSESSGSNVPTINITYIAPDYSVADGIYNIQNLHTNSFLGVENTAIANGALTQMCAENQTAPDKYGQMWKIEQDGNTEYYSVRPMYNQKLALTAENNVVKVRNTGSTDTKDLTDRELWTISHNDTGYEFVNKYNGLAMNPSGSAIIMTAYSSTNTAQNWKLNRVEGPMLLLYSTSSGELISSSELSSALDAVYIEYSSTALTLAQIGVELEIVYTSSSNRTVVWNSSNPSVSQIDLTTGAVTCLGIGGTQVTVSLQISDNVYQLSFPLITTAPLTSESILYCHYYDSSIDVARVEQIDKAVALTSIAYYRQFGISCGSRGNPTYNTSFTSGEHKNRDEILMQLDALSSSSNEVSVLWTNYGIGVLCTHTASEECVPTLSNAVTWNGHPAMIMIDLKTQLESADYYWARMAYYLIHETVHTFGIDDRYEISSHLGNGYQCIMEAWDDHDGNLFDEADEADKVLLEFCQKILNGECNAFCDTCADDIREELSK